jgi:hypothetical protein
VRQALVTVQLVQTARDAAAAEAARRPTADAPPETPAAPKQRPRRVSTLLRRARARTLGLRAY